MSEIEAYSLQPGEKLILRPLDNPPLAGKFLQLFDRALTVPLAMDCFKMCMADAIKYQFDAPILIVESVKGKTVWSAPRTKRPDVMVDIQCKACQRHYDLQLPLEGFKCWSLGLSINVSFPELLDCEKVILATQICGACKSR